MKYKCLALQILALLLIWAVPVRSQIFAVDEPGDTVHARSRTSQLDDGSRFFIELGAVRVKHAGATRFLTFADTTGRLPYQYFRTVNFIANGSADTIGFSRFASFDDSATIVGITYASADSNVMDSMLTTVFNHYHNRAVSPSSGMFGSTSSILYIAELHDATTDTVTSILDTTVCYRDGAGHLRYMNLDASRDSYLLGLPLYGTSVGQSVYLSVRTVMNLPSGPGFTSHTYSEVAGNSSHGLHLVMECQDLAARKIIAKGFTSPVETNAKISIDKIVPNPAHANVDVAIENYVGGEITFQIVALGSGAVLMTRSAIVNNGKTNIRLSLEALPSGDYFLVVSNGVHTASSKITLSR